MSMVRIAAIVEGHGECEAVPVLIRRIARTIDPGFEPQVLPPIQVPAASLIKAGELERAVELAARKLRVNGGIIVLLDCDWDQCCPAREAPMLLRRARAVRPDKPISVILAKKEYEAWFLAAAESLRGKRGLSAELQTPEDPESIRDAKGRLSQHMPHGQSYKETIDQAALTSQFDLELARRSDSFNKCYRDLKTMLENLLYL